MFSREMIAVVHRYLAVQERSTVLLSDSTNTTPSPRDVSMSTVAALQEVAIGMIQLDFGMIQLDFGMI